MSTDKTLDVVDNAVRDTNSCLKSGKIIKLPRSSTQDREAERAILRDWLESLRESTQLSYEQIGRRAGLDPSNLTRFVKPGSTTGIGLGTIRKISKEFSVPPPPIGADFESKPAGFSDRELSPWQPNEDPAKDHRNGIDWWEVGTNLLELDGIYRGDKIEVDMNRHPQEGDIVIAQVETNGGRNALTILRRYEPPYLICRTFTQRSPRPEIVDNRRVIIMGVVVSLKRQMTHSAA